MQLEMDVISKTVLFCIFFIGVFVGVSLNCLVQIYLSSLSKKYEDKEWDTTCIRILAATAIP